MALVELIELAYFGNITVIQLVLRLALKDICAGEIGCCRTSQCVAVSTLTTSDANAILWPDCLLFSLKLCCKLHSLALANLPLEQASARKWRRLW